MKWGRAASAEDQQPEAIASQDSTASNPQMDMSGPALSMSRKSNGNGGKPNGRLTQGKVLLPWPPKGLSPNDRAHWRVKAKATASYRYSAKMLAIEAGWLDLPAKGLHVTYCPKPTGAIPDEDNMVARFKAARDGFADVFGINDRDLKVTFALGDRCKDGAIIVEVVR